MADDTTPPTPDEADLDALRSLLGLLEGELRQLDDLVPRRPTRDDADLRLRKTQDLCKQRDDLVVRPAALGRRVDAELPGLAETPDDL